MSGPIGSVRARRSSQSRRSAQQRVLGWSAPDGLRPRPIVHFVFDGGVLADGTAIRLQEDELDDYRFVDEADLPRYLPPMISTRVAAGLRSRGTGSTVYLPWPGREPARGVSLPGA